MTTVEDLLHWEENFRNPRVGGPAFITQMLQRGVLNDGEPLDYAFGLVWGEYRALTTIGHSGSDAGYRTNLQRFPDQHFSVACLCNRSDANPSGMLEGIADIYLEKELQRRESQANQPPGIKLSEEQLSVHAGTYLNRNTGITQRFTAQGGRLTSTPVRWGSPEALIALDANRLRLTRDRFSIDVVFSGSGNTRQVTVTAPREKRVVYQWVLDFEASPSQLSFYVGVYRSDEIGLPYQVYVADGMLKLNLLKVQSAALTPITRDVFISEFDAMPFATAWDRFGHCATDRGNSCCRRLGVAISDRVDGEHPGRAYGRALVARVDANACGVQEHRPGVRADDARHAHARANVPVPRGCASAHDARSHATTRQQP